MDDHDGPAVREQDRFLPIANISRIMKKALPANAKIAKDAKETVQECVSELISFITSEASDKCQREKRKTINGDDLLWAMSTLGFEDYVEPLKIYLQKYRESELQGEQAKVANKNNHEAKDPVALQQMTQGQAHGMGQVAGGMHGMSTVPQGMPQYYQNPSAMPQLQGGQMPPGMPGMGAPPPGGPTSQGY